MPETATTETQPAKPHSSGRDFAHMLGGLVGLLLVGPLLRTFVPDWTSAILWLTVGVAMAAGTWSLVDSIAGRAASCFAGSTFTCVGWLASYLSLPALHAVAAVALLLFCVWAIASSLRQVLLGRRVDLNRIFGAVCVYLLMGVAWAVCYLLIALSLDGSFHGLSGDNPDELWSRVVYFSFVTLTTLGYGDISPVVPIAQTLAYLEALVGQLYIAILVAALVGAYLNTRDRNDP